MGNKARVVVLAVGVYDLTLPSGLFFQLKNYYYMPAMSRNIISVSCLDVDGFHFIIKNNIFFIYNTDIFYRNAHLANGLYVLNLNRIPSKAVEKTPYELWTGKRPGLSFLKIWGCEAYVKRQASDKLASKSDKCLFVGYPKKTKGYYFYIPSENKVFVACYGVFLEIEFISKRVSGSKTSLEEVQEPQVATEPSMEILQDSQPVVESTSSAQGPRRSSRIHQEPKRYGFLVTDDKTIELGDQDEPTSYHETMMSPDSEKCLQAMKSKMKSMYDNQVWNLVDPLEGAKVIGCKWVHEIKHDMTFKS